MAPSDHRRLDRLGRLVPAVRAPSPEVCMGCLKPHRRVEDAETAAALRTRFERSLELLMEPRAGDERWRYAETHRYLKDLFWHLTRGRKVSQPDEEQAHPAPVPPEMWSARFLTECDRFVLQHTERNRQT